ncbi:hypothetical protein FRX31_027164, partial [Thalictrum thalictroides]
AFEKHNVEKEIAEQIKKDFDKKRGPTWHCIYGRNFGKNKASVKELSTPAPATKDLYFPTQYSQSTWGQFK